LQEFFEGRFIPERSFLYADFMNELEEATRTSQSHIADRCLNIWGGLEARLPGVQDLELRSCDQGYGLRHLVAHLAALGNAVALQCRCALIVASLNSRVQNILPGLLTELMRKIVWLPRQGLAYARHVLDSYQRVQALASLTPHLSEGRTRASAARDAAHRPRH
jgi:hypothetical protein